jgi:5-methylcytosine-specific restriction endonuclease McrA
MSSKVIPVTIEMPLKLGKRRRKQNIPRAVKEQLWLRDMGKEFQGKCMTSWCQNMITLFDFQCGHNIPESKGGKTVLDNLVPICSRCNTSMGNQYTFTEWSEMHKTEPPKELKKKWWRIFFPCIYTSSVQA